MTTQGGGAMKKPIVVSMIMALIMLLGGSVFAPAHPQDPAKEDKPTFYRLTPGVYVNGWPRFTVRFPKDWGERIGSVVRGAVYLASSPGGTPHPAIIRVVVGPYPFPLDKWVGDMVKFYNSVGFKDVTLVSDKPSQLRDGTPAKEVEFRMVANTVPRTDMMLATKKGDMLIFVSVQSLSAKIEEDLKAILYSIEFQPDQDEPVKIPLDVQEFLDRHCNDLISHDLAKFMTHYSDRYLNSGIRKGEMERMWKQFIGLVTSAEVCITDFVPAGDRAYLTGFGVNNLGKSYIQETSIIKENGEWKWYGNQRDAIPDPRFE
jgi:hypothetical protein